jgi:deazaflavin-dependent oxidoreductase (nitroreductase family)
VSEPNRVNWNDKIIEEFRANEGRVGGPFEGASMILIHHVGAKTGTERVNPLAYLADGDDMIIAASKGGAPTNPDWYHNLKAHPRITVEVGTDTFTVDAIEETGAERDELWRRLVAERPGFGEYEKKTSRVIPMFRLTRVG